jgi:hypothetical protein
MASATSDGDDICLLDVDLAEDDGLDRRNMTELRLIVVQPS